MKYLFALLAILVASTISGFTSSEPTFFDDAKIAKSLNDKLGDIVDADADAVPTSKELAKQLTRKSCQVQLPAASETEVPNIYNFGVRSTVVISSIYKCDKCDDWHQGGGASGWILTSDGIMVTNYHVFRGKDVAAFGIRTHDGKVAPIVEILAANERHDIAIFRVKGSGFEPLVLGPDPGVGEAIHIIAHPDRRYFTYTAGYVSRYFKIRQRGLRQGVPMMAVTAEFARGSSGGPAMNDAGQLVGMVASTQSIYSPPKDKKKDPKGQFQMVIRNCVPVSSIRELIRNPS